MAGVNRVTIVGNVGADPEIRALNNGNRVGNFNIATSESWTDKATGERQERTEWHRIVVFNDRLVDLLEKYVRKGSKLYLEGSLQTRKWVDQQGSEKYTTEVVLKAYGGELQMLDRPPQQGPDQGGHDQRGYDQRGGGGQPRQARPQQGGYDQRGGDGYTNGGNRQAAPRQAPPARQGAPARQAPQQQGNQPSNQQWSDVDDEIPF